MSPMRPPTFGGVCEVLQRGEVVSSHPSVVLKLWSNLVLLFGDKSTYPQQMLFTPVFFLLEWAQRFC